MRTTVRPPTPPPRARGPGRGGGVEARVGAIALGLWLFVSAFLWPHSDPSGANSLVVGALMVVVGTWALRSTLGRVVNGMLAAWLLVSTAVITPRAELTFWNNLIVGAAVLMLSLVPTSRRQRPAAA